MQALTSTYCTPWTFFFFKFSFSCFLLKTHTGWNTTGPSILCNTRWKKEKKKKKNHVTTAERAVSLLTMWWCCFFASCSSSHLIWCKWQHRWFTGDRTLSQSNFITNVLSINKNTLPEGTREKKRSHISTFIYKNHPDKNTGTFSVETTRNDHDLPLGALIAQN